MDGRDISIDVFHSYAQNLRSALFYEELEPSASLTVEGYALKLKSDDSIIIVLNRTMPNGDQVWYVNKRLLSAKFVSDEEGDLCTVIVNSENSDQVIDGILDRLKPEREIDTDPSLPILARRMTGFRLANFKTFEEEQHVPIRPLTLIFGPNSGGKSSIIQGLIFANEAIRTGNLNTFTTQLGGNSIDLGGFRQYIHKGQLDRQLALSICFDAENVSHSCRMGSYFDDYIDIISFKITVGMQLDYAGRPLKGGEPTIRSFSVEGDGNTLLRLHPRPDGFFYIDYIAQEFPMFKDMLRSDLYRNKNTNTPTEIFAKLISLFRIPIGILLPNGIEKDPRVRSSEREWVESFFPSESEMKYSPLANAGDFETEALYLIEELSSVVRRVLERLQYLGPLRSYPSRDLVSKEHYDLNWFAGGGYAWDVVKKDSEVRKKVNAWLADKDKLSTPYEFISYDFEPVGKSKSDRTMQKLSLLDKRNDTPVSHRDVGIGISQVLPVLVSAYASRKKIIAIEQPEIHLHPALQAELADVFIESAIGKNQNTFILETHSEHLLLRMMRRMRETANGTLENPDLTLTPKDIAVLYVEPVGSSSIVREMPLNEQGELIKAWPGGFFEEGLREIF